MAELKAIVGLSRGRVAYFDPKSNIMVDLAHPVAHVYEGTDVSELKKALGGSIYLVHGSLSDEPVIEEVKAEPVVEVVAEVKEEQSANTEVAEKVEEPKTEEVVAEKPAAKKRTTKK